MATFFTDKAIKPFKLGQVIHTALIIGNVSVEEALDFINDEIESDGKQEGNDQDEEDGQNGEDGQDGEDGQNDEDEDNDEEEENGRNNTLFTTVQGLAGRWLVELEKEGRGEFDSVSLIAVNKLLYPATDNNLTDVSMIKFVDSEARFLGGQNQILYTVEVSKYFSGTVEIPNLFNFELGNLAIGNETVSVVVGDIDRNGDLILGQVFNKGERVIYKLRKL